MTMLKIKSWPKLIFSIVIAQSAGFIGTFFTIEAIPTWYATLNRPSFSPPNWVFGPVWTILYTLIGISLYRIWIKNKKGSLKLFFLHLFLNAVWSPIFFGLQNLGLAFVIIFLMDITLIIIINNFYKLDKLASYLLIPYLLWIGFASLLNLSFWKLNGGSGINRVFAQDLAFTKAREDYIFVEDNYKRNLSDLEIKKDAYRKNPTLSLKEEARISYLTFAKTRNDYIRSYFTVLRSKSSESKGLSNSEKQEIYRKIDPEVVWHEKRNDDYKDLDTLEDIVNKIKEDVIRYEQNKPIIYFTLANISLGEVKNTKEEHISLYNKLKGEANELIKLGRADAGLFDRWFRDIDQEINNLSDIESKTKKEIDKIYGADEYQRSSGYKKALETLDPAKFSLLNLNRFIKELDNTIQSKR